MAPSMLSPVILVWTATEHFPMPPVLQSSSWFVNSTIAPSFALRKAIMVIKITYRKCYYLLYQNISQWDTSPLSCKVPIIQNIEKIEVLAWTYKTQLHLSPIYFNIKYNRSFIHSFIPLACAECDDSLLFSGASSIPLCYVLFPATLLHQLFFHPLSSHLAIYFLVYLPILFPNSYTILTYLLHGVESFLRS